MFCVALLLSQLLTRLPSPMTAAEVYKKASPSVVSVMVLRDEDHSTQGSGVVLDSRSVVTNWHVVKDGSIISVITSAQEVALAILVAQDVERDLAVLRVTGLGVGEDGSIGSRPVLAPTKVCKRAVEVGERVFAIGSPKGLELSLSDGLVSQIRREASRTLIQTNAAISHGSSGGGLFNERAELIGLTTEFLEDGQALNFAVPVSYVERLRAAIFSPEAAKRFCDLPADIRELIISRSEHRDRRLLASLVGSCPPTGQPSLETTSLVPAGTTAKGLAAMPETIWREFTIRRRAMESHPDFELGFLVARELRDCRCHVRHPAAVLALYLSGGVLADELSSVGCEACVQRAFDAWAVRIDKQCKLMPALTVYELEILRRSDDGNGIPPRCYLERSIK